MDGPWTDAVPSASRVEPHWIRPGADQPAVHTSQPAWSGETVGRAGTRPCTSTPTSGSPAITLLAARVNRRTLLLGLIALFLIGNGLSAVAPNLALLVVFRFVAGSVPGAFFGAGAGVLTTAGLLLNVTTVGRDPAPTAEAARARRGGDF